MSPAKSLAVEPLDRLRLAGRYSPVLPLIITAIFGLFVGSFLNVCCHRLPRNRGIAQPPSACGACGTRLAWHENLPLWGWLGTWGRCRHCGTRFSPRYLLAELIVAGLSVAAVAWAFYGVTYVGSPA